MHLGERILMRRRPHRHIHVIEIAKQIQRPYNPARCLVQQALCEVFISHSFIFRLLKAQIGHVK